MEQRSLPTQRIDIDCGLHTGAVNAIRFNSKGSYCVSAGADRSVALFNPTRKLVLKRYVGHGYPVLDVQISADDMRIVSSGMDKLLFYFDVMTGKVVRKFGGTRSGGHTERVNALALGYSMPGTADLNASLIASGSYDSSVRLWDPRSNNAEPIQVLRDAKDSVTSVQIRGACIFAASVDEHVRVYDVRTAKVYEDWVGSPVGSCAISHDGKCILLSCLDSTLRLVERSTGDVLAVYFGHRNVSFPIHCAFMCDDAFVCCGSEDGVVNYWDLVDASVRPTGTLSITGSETASASAPSCAVGAVDVHPDNYSLIAGSHTGNIVLWKG